MKDKCIARVFEWMIRIISKMIPRHHWSQMVPGDVPDPCCPAIGHTGHGKDPSSSSPENTGRQGNL
jgi:hypothetical protein